MRPAFQNRPFQYGLPTIFVVVVAVAFISLLARWLEVDAAQAVPLTIRTVLLTFFVLALGYFIARVAEQRPAPTSGSDVLLFLFATTLTVWTVLAVLYPWDWSWPSSAPRPRPRLPYTILPTPKNGHWFPMATGAIVLFGYIVVVMRRIHHSPVELPGYGLHLAGRTSSRLRRAGWALLLLAGTVTVAALVFGMSQSIDVRLVRRVPYYDEYFYLPTDFDRSWLFVSHLYFWSIYVVLLAAATAAWRLWRLGRDGRLPPYHQDLYLRRIATAHALAALMLSLDTAYYFFYGVNDGFGEPKWAGRWFLDWGFFECLHAWIGWAAIVAATIVLTAPHLNNLLRKHGWLYVISAVSILGTFVFVWGTIALVEKSLSNGVPIQLPIAPEAPWPIR